MEKLKISLDFYFKVQFANRVSVDLSLNKTTLERYRVYVGPGNNQFMVQQILRKRFWYEVVHEPKDCDFYWTLNDMRRVHDGQHGMKRAKKWQDHEDNKSE